eukprot:m.69236 g.69236  ORF g.69236 m.69236 type:complete len:457 (+) comp35587_c0_seq1:33-1403(+)
MCYSLGGILSRILPSSSPSSVSSPRKHRRGVVFLLAVIAFATNTSFCVLLPFYPQELASRLDDATTDNSGSLQVGFVFSACSLSYFCCALISGSWINAIGAKPILVWGTLALSATTFALAALTLVNDYALFIGLSLVVSVFQGMAGAAGETACFALACREFPDSVGTVVGILEQGVGVGIMVASPLGGTLYSLGGFSLPFFVLGGALLPCAVLAASLQFDAPPAPAEANGDNGAFGTCSLLKNFQLSLCASCGIVTAALLGFLDTNLATFLTDAYSMTPGKIGVVFVLSRGFYALLAPLIGKMADSLGPRRIISIGLTMCWVGFFIMAQCRFLSAFLLAQGVIGVGVAMGSIPCFIDMMKTAVVAGGGGGGDDDNDAIVVGLSGTVSGLLAAAFAFGEGAGSLLSGFVAESLGFYGSAGIFGLFMFFHWTMYVAFAVFSHGGGALSVHKGLRARTL